MSPFRTPGEVAEDEEEETVERDPYAVEKCFIAGVVAVIAIIVGGIVAYAHVESRAPCREGKVAGYTACPAGARAELKDGDTWCRCEVKP